MTTDEMTDAEKAALRAFRQTPQDERLNFVRNLLTPGQWDRCHKCRGKGRIYEREPSIVRMEVAAMMLSEMVEDEEQAP